MPTKLRAKLDALTKNAPPPKRNTGGLLCYSETFPADERLYRLSGTALKRIGWSGRAFDIEKCLFLDTETTGLARGAGTIAFLVGIGFVENGTLTVEQYLMRDYPDEAALIERVAEKMRTHDFLCTFNGRTFDMPLLRERFTMCRMRDSWREMEDLDLLPPSRRTWKLRLNCCKLSRLEEQILGTPREGDLPGSEVPTRFFDFLKSGDMTLLDDIVKHNRQDIVTLSALLIKLTEIYDSPCETLTEKKDLFSVGLSLEKQGEWKSAKALYRIAAVPQPVKTITALRGDRVSGMANMRLYIIARKNKNTEEMRAILEQMLKRDQFPYETRIELAKFYEHRDVRIARALRYAQEALSYCAEKDKPLLEKRIARLISKQSIQDDL